MAQAYEYTQVVVEPEPRPRPRPRLLPAAQASLAVLRVGAGLLYMEHGAQKLWGMFGGVGPAGGAVPLVSQMGLAGVLEFFGGLLIVLGFFTRFVAPVLTIEMLWAFTQAHLPRGWAPIRNGGELALLYALIFFVLTFLGPGAFSIDHGRTLNERR